MNRRPLDWSWVLGLLILLFGVPMATAPVLADEGLTGLSFWAAVVPGLFLCALGTWNVRHSIRANRFTLARNRRREQYPDEPWRWRAEWDAGRIEHVARKSGTTVLELQTVPARPGGQLRGRIVVPALDCGAGCFVATLKATHHYRTRRGKSALQHLDTLFEQNLPVTLEATPAGLIGVVVFEIPTDAVSSNDDHPNTGVDWQLSVNGELAGRRYHASFEVPVFSDRS